MDRSGSVRTPNTIYYSPGDDLTPGDRFAVPAPLAAKLGAGPGKPEIRNQHYLKDRTQRNPVLSRSLTGLFRLRLAARILFTLKYQEPPRITRYSPFDGPRGFVFGLVW